MKDFVLQHEKLIEFSAWTVVETYTALICANLPPMTTLLRRTINKITSSAGLSSGSGSGPINTGEKRSGSGSGSGSSSSDHKTKKYIKFLRHKRSGSEAHLARKAAPFGFSWPRVPLPPADSPSVGSPNVPTAAATEGSLSSPPTHARGPTVMHQPGGRFHYLPFHHQHRQGHGNKATLAPPLNGIEVETDVDIEKADINEVVGAGRDGLVAGTAVHDDCGATDGGRTSIENQLLSNSAMMAANSRPWGTVTTVMGSGPGGINNVSNNGNSSSSASANAKAKAIAKSSTNINTNITGSTTGNVGHHIGHGHGVDVRRFRTRTTGAGGAGEAGGGSAVVQSATENNDNALTKTPSTNSYQVGLPIQRLDSDGIGVGTGV